MAEPIRLTEMVTGGGCAAKLGPVELSAALRGLNVRDARRVDSDVLVGIELMDDAGVTRLTDEIALVQTIDFITPIVDDPFTYGEIAATNAISDIYAMGGTPKTAMNVVCFPREGDKMILGDILRGGLAAMDAAGVALVGGHSVCDPEIKYGLSVAGVVHPDQIWTNAGAEPGDALVFTKALGTGVISSGLKQRAASEESVAAAILSMRTLNRAAKELAEGLDVHACTDVTGFGMAGHLHQLLRASGMSAEIDASEIPLLPGALELARGGYGPGGLDRNRVYAGGFVRASEGVDPALLDLLFDPQTSGGLLLALSPWNADTMVTERRKSGLPASIIGEIRHGDAGYIGISP
jgi:selenide,water dikinase